MASYVFDIETDGLYADLTKVHSLVLRDVDTNDVYSYTPNEIEQGLRQMMEADKLIAHNGINFDIPALSKVYPWFSVDRERVVDTLIISRLTFPNLGDRDLRLVQTGRLESKFRGSHSLSAWGYRLGVLKGEFGQSTDWSEWSQEMQEYCEQDTEVTLHLWKHLSAMKPSQQAVELEHAVAWIISEQTRHGFLFDRAKADKLMQRLASERAAIDDELQTVFDPWVSAVEEKTPTRDVNYKSVTRHSTWAGASYTVIKHNVFNPNSRHHIANRLKALYGWKPKEFTDKGQPKIDENVLGRLSYPEAQKLSRAMMLQKRISQLGEGDNSWIGLADAEGRIHGEVNTNGAVTGRMTHNKPNLAQVPSLKKPFGRECRELFTVPSGKKLVGVDVSGLELRMLAHYLAHFDNGSYGEEVVNGDIHTANQKAAGLPTRDSAKTFIYAFLYGAGSEKIGSIIGKGAKEGQKLKTTFLEATPALSKLITMVTKAASRGYLVGLDGRQLHIRSSHAALNTLLQSAGALVCKQWAVEMDKALLERGLKDRCQVVANVHDEHQYECDEEIAEEIGKLSVECIKKAGQHFNIKVDLDGEYKVGNNWAETH
jgi:DNA polymerase I-like protein with 3'-5' exonuclease and polymerase domains